MDLHTGKPLERGSRDVVVVADAQDGRIGIEARQDRIADHHAATGTVALGGVSMRSRTTVQSQIAPRMSNTASATKNGS